VPEDHREDEAASKVVSDALRALLEGAVDYAGLFPPASVDVPTAVRNYAAYRASEDRWMLGRFVVGVAKLPELRSTVAAAKMTGEAWPVTVVVPDAAAATSVLRGTDDARLRVEAGEVRAQTPADVTLVSRAAPKTREVYLEVALDATLPAMLDAIAAAKLRAKIRTGGVTADAFPPAEQVVAFIRGCLDRAIPFKATAGLHHPLRGSYRLTYDGGAPSGEMFGFLNVFLATAFMREEVSDREAAELLAERDPAAITTDERGIHWRTHTIDAASVRGARTRAITSFGSCSFREPVDELPYPVTSKAPA
jgi:hypothetical protein